MKKGILTIFVLVLCISAFLETKSQTLLKDGEIPKDLEISLVRTACFGSCPDYSLTIKYDGSVTFDGRYYTGTNGKAEGKITNDQIKHLVSEFEGADFFSLQNRYVKSKDGCKEVWTDNPAEIISIKLNSKSKTVSHYFGCRKVKGNALDTVINLGEKIDEITNSKQWVAGWKPDSNTKILY